MNIPQAAALLCGLSLLASCATTAPQPVADPAAATVRSRVDASVLDAAREAERHGDYPGAQAYYRSAYDRDPKSIEAIVGLSRMLRALSRPREAVTIAERGLLAHERNPQIMAELGKGQLAANDTLQAVESLSRAGALLPDDWEIQSALGVGYDRMSMYDQAVHRYEKALTLKPGNGVILNNYALSLAQAGNLEQAVAMMEKAVSTPERTTQMRQNLALLYAMTGQIEAAERLVRQDLPAEMATDNIMYYRRIARKTNRAGTSLNLRPSSPMPQSTPEPGPRSEMAPAPASSASSAPALPVTPVATAGLTPPSAADPGHPPAVREGVANPPPASPPSAEAPAPARIRTPPSPDSGHVGTPAELTAATSAEREPQGRSDDRAPASATVPEAAPALSTGTTSAGNANDSAPTALLVASSTPGVRRLEATDAGKMGTKVEPSAKQAPVAASTRPTPTSATTVPPSSAPPAPAKSSSTTTVADAAPRADPANVAASSPHEPSKRRLAGTEDYSSLPSTEPSDNSPSAAAATATPAPGGDRAENKVASLSSANSGERPYRIQIGSYRNEGDAKAGIAKLLAAHEDLVGPLSLDVVHATIDGGDYFRVLTAPMVSKGDAADVCQELQNRDIACFVRRDP